MDVQITINATPEEAQAELARFLDSGEYPQAKGVLCRRFAGIEGYCCLGVASEIGVALGLVEKTVVEFGQEDGPLEASVEYSGEQATLGPVLQQFFGMTSTGQYRPADGSKNGELTNQNDHEGKTFAEIAVIVRTAEFILPHTYR